MKIRLILSALLLAPLVLGCWDEIKHTYDCNDDTSGDADTDTDTDVDADTDTDADADGGYERSGLPDGWQGFGEACDEHEDCTGYPGERRCLTDVLGLINVPDGYCSSCCDEEEIDGCAPGIDCVGANGVYLVCLMHCEDHSDCREDDGYECLPIYYIPDVFPGTYCMPKNDLVTPDTDQPVQDPDCPWPWT